MLFSNTLFSHFLLDFNIFHIINNQSIKQQQLVFQLQRSIVYLVFCLSANFDCGSLATKGLFENHSMPPKPKSIQKRTPTEYNKCKWESCQYGGFSSFQELAEHVNAEHVDPMIDQDIVHCLWKECRMFNKPCYSHEWLQRHVRMHTGEKPFKCIIVGCVASFMSTEALSKHVETHFKERRKSLAQMSKLKVSSNRRKPKPAKKTTSSIVKPVDNGTCTNVKAINSEDLEETPGYFRVEDDDFGLSSLLIFKSTAAYLTRNDCYHGHKSRNNITLHATFCGKRFCSGQQQVLVRWKPPLIDDEWLPAADIPPYMTVSFSQLSYQKQCQLASCLTVAGNRRRKGTPHKLTDHLY